MDKGKWLTPEEAAESTGLAKTTIISFAKRELIPAKKVSGTYRISGELIGWAITKKAAKRTGFAVKTVRKYAKEGRIMAKKLGRIYLVNIRSLGNAKRPYFFRCADCGKLFWADRKSGKFCSAACRIRYHNRMYKRRLAKLKREQNPL